MLQNEDENTRDLRIRLVKKLSKLSYYNNKENYKMCEINEKQC